MIDPELLEKINEVIEAAEADQVVYDILQNGTPEQKRRLLEERFGLSFEDLMAMYKELQTILNAKGLPFWWW